MKFTMLFAVLLGAAAVPAAGTPVEQVVNLLQTMKDQITSDGKAEQQIYDKYACWCETTSTRKASHIVAGGEELRSLGQRILKLKGKVATRTAEIAELTATIKDNEAEQEEATAIRQKENAAWQAEAEETKQALAALQEAITVLSDATAPGKSKKAALLQQSARLRSQNAVKTVLEKVPLTSRVSDKAMALLSEFTSDKAGSGYAPQSATIQGMLGDMYLTFSANLESATQDEANKNSNYEDVYAKLEKSNNELKATRTKKESEKADAEAMLADTTKAYDDSEQQMKADTAFFDQTKAACESKHEEWTVRDKMRTEELDGITEALKILTSDEARELFAKSIKPGVEAFLQIASAPTGLLQDAASLPAAQAYAALKAQVRQSRSIRLAALAVKVRTAKAGHFDAVIKAIDDMMKTLQDEGAADIAKKDQCLNEYQSINRKVSKLTWKIKNNEAKIEKLDKLIELRTEEKAQTNERIKETNQYMDDLTKERKAENEAFLQAKKDDEGAIALLEKAKDALAKFYEKQGVEMGDIQGSVKFLQAEPVFERSKDDAPDATFSDKGHRKGQSKNILSLLSYISEDLSDEIAAGRKAEAQSQAEYEEEMTTAKKLKADLQAKVVTLDDIISKRKSDKEEQNKDMKANNGDKTAELDYETKIKPDCDWIIGAFDKRATARAAEMDGLTTAKEFLAGQSALLEKSGKVEKTFDDQVLPSIGFLGISH